MKVVVDDKIPYIHGVLEPFTDVRYVPGGKITNEIISDADALIIRTRTTCNQKLLEGSSVKFIATATIGYDHIDIGYCAQSNITWTNAPGCNSGSVMQYLAAALLYYAREKNIALSERVLGVVGVGNVGRKIVRLAEVLGMKVYLNDPPRAENEGPCSFLTLDSIAREADIITFHVPLCREGKYPTYHLANSHFFSKLNPATLFINTARGEVMDSEALKMFLSTGKLADTILDVWENEPGIDSGLLNKAFIATPHIAGYSADGKANGTKMAVRSLSKFFNLGFLDDWEPDEVPSAGESIIHCNGYGKDFQQIATELILKTYDIKAEDQWLKSDIARFEEFRGSYPLRREFNAYTVLAENISDDYLQRIKRLGFRIT
jgi:erythronate-4-phosphate dehydrogenase